MAKFHTQSIRKAWRFGLLVLVGMLVPALAADAYIITATGTAERVGEGLYAGWYKYTWASFDLTKDYVFTADGGAGQPVGERYAPIDMAGASLSGKIDVIDGIVDAILEDTGTTIPALLAALNDISVADILAGVIEGTITVRRAIAAILSGVALKADGGGSTEIDFRNYADSLDRIRMIVNEAGDRSAVTLDFSDM